MSKGGHVMFNNFNPTMTLIIDILMAATNRMFIKDDAKELVRDYVGTKIGVGWKEREMLHEAALIALGVRDSRISDDGLCMLAEAMKRMSL
jgi:hypothetical protein